MRTKDAMLRSNEEMEEGDDNVASQEEYEEEAEEDHVEGEARKNEADEAGLENS